MEYGNILKFHVLPTARASSLDGREYVIPIDSEVVKKNSEKYQNMVKLDGLE